EYKPPEDIVMLSACAFLVLIAGSPFLCVVVD
ncbi:MAG: hypothetical protein ACJAZF_001719, partial [Granulosicoccus sp.]